MLLPIAVSNILRRVSHKFYPQAPSLLKRVRPSISQEYIYSGPYTSRGRSWNVSPGRDASLKGWWRGDMRISAHLEIAKGCGQDAEAQVVVETSRIVSNPATLRHLSVWSIISTFTGGCRSSVSMFLPFDFLGQSSWFLDIILRRWTDVAIPCTYSNLAVNTLI